MVVLDEGPAAMAESREHGLGGCLLDPLQFVILVGRML